MLKSLFLSFTVILALQVVAQKPVIIPEPVNMVTGTGTFNVTPKTKLIATTANNKHLAFINDYLMANYGYKLPVSNKLSDKGIKLVTEKHAGEMQKGYELQVKKDGVTISGENEGLFYGVVTLLQLFPVEKNKLAFAIPELTIQDYPRFGYRGMHLDVARHFFPVDFVKRYIDYLALHKMNYFHWHLTDDQGWRIQIKQYPKLTEVGAWRNGTIIGRYPGTGNTNTRVGGFYTQEQVKEVVKYAADRFITVVPEIEMPGHAAAAIAAYPELSAFPDEPTIQYYPKQSAWGGDSTGKQVIQSWGVYDDVFVPSENTFKFLENVMDEVIALFPSKYIHVGGDECPKTNWKRSAFCQQLMKEKGLKDEHELQSYFIQRMEKYINQKGRTIIGWDEILEGGLAPNAIVMSWQGEKGGIEAAKQHHYVIMTPGNPVYFDHSQSSREDSVTIGGYNPIEKVYAYDPIPAELNAEQAKYILGAQANLWTEYINNPRKVEYMVFPRMSALSEVLWTQLEKKDLKNFEQKLLTQFKRYDLWKANYSEAFYDLKTSVIPGNNGNGVLWSLDTKFDNAKITFTKGETGVAPQNYTQPIAVNTNGLYTASLWVNNIEKSKASQAFSFNKATGKKITLAKAPSTSYPGSGAFTLVDGIQNSKGMSLSREFIGYNGEDAEALIDLGTAQEISTVTLHTFESNGSWIYAPKYCKVLISTDGQNFTQMGITDMVNAIGKRGDLTMTVNQKAVTTRYIKVVVGNYGVIPQGKEGGGHKAWLFLDEIVVE
jgi:hexosaminidase